MTNLVGVLYAVILLVLCAGYVDVARGQTTDPTEGKSPVFFAFFSPSFGPDNWKLLLPGTNEKSFTIYSWKFP
jgi:hypothetical protein